MLILLSVADVSTVSLVIIKLINVVSGVTKRQVLS